MSNGHFADQGERRGGTRYIRSLREHWPFIALTVIAALIAAFGYSSLAGKRYQASADILVSPVSNDDAAFTGLPVIRESVESRSVVTVARLLRSPQVADDVRRRLGLDLPREELLEQVEVRPQEQSNIVTVVAEASTPAEAARIANGFADALIAQRKAHFERSLRNVLERLSASGGAAGPARSERIATLRGLLGEGDPTLQIASRAVEPSKPSWPRPALSLAVALLAGLLIGMGIAVALEMISPLVLSDDELTAYGAAVLARVPRLSRNQRRALQTEGRLPADTVDSYRLLLAQLARHGKQPRFLVVTSPSAALDRATVSLLLAHLARPGGRAVLVDADLRGRALSSLLDVEPPSSSRANGGPPSSAALQGGRIQLLSHEPGPGLGELEDLATRGELVIVDAPSPSSSAEAFELATEAERVLVVVSLGRTRQDALAALMTTLANAGTAASFVVVQRRFARGRNERVGETAAEPTFMSAS
jgi:capsular polysaccharide biosynthesis protein